MQDMLALSLSVPHGPLDGISSRRACRRGKEAMAKEGNAIMKREAVPLRRHLESHPLLISKAWGSPRNPVPLHSFPFSIKVWVATNSFPLCSSSHVGKGRTGQDSHGTLNTDRSPWASSQGAGVGQEVYFKLYVSGKTQIQSKQSVAGSISISFSGLSGSVYTREAESTAVQCCAQDLGF